MKIPNQGHKQLYGGAQTISQKKEFHKNLVKAISLAAILVTALALVRHAQRNSFDPGFTSNAAIDYAFGIPLDFTGMDGVPMVPVFVNAYVPPQPAMERCYAFGRVLGDGIRALGLRAVVVCSGGLSHYPGTERYMDPGPDTEFDLHFMEMMGRRSSSASR